jgi:aminopeptidase N
MGFTCFLLSFLTAASVHAIDLDKKAFYLPNTDIDVSSYKVHLTVPQLAAVDLQAQAVLELKTLAPLKYVQLHASREALAVKNTAVNGAAAKSRFVNEYVLQVELPQPVPAGAHLVLEFTYTIRAAQLTKKGQAGLFYSSGFNGMPLISVEDWPYYTRTWIPSNDNPADPAAFELTVDVPKGISALSNGELVGKDTSGLDADRFHWRTKTEFPTYGLNLVVGKYKELSEEICFSLEKVNDELVPCEPGFVHTTLHFYSPDNGSDLKPAWETVQKAAKSVVFFSSVLGTYRFEKVAFIEAPQHFLMEYPSLITSPYGSVHELAHHWFGDSVFIKHWGDLWISEGFTTYLDEVLYQEYLGQTVYEPMPKRKARFNFPEETDVLKIFDDAPYHGGASAVAALRSHIDALCGLEKSKDRELFYGVLRSVFQKFSTHPLGTQELVEFLHSTLPETLGQHQCVPPATRVHEELGAWASEWFDP